MKGENVTAKIRFAANKNIKEKKYWLDKLSGEIENTGFPYDYRRKEDSRRMQRIEFKLPEELTLNLSNRVKDNHHALHIYLVTTLALMLDRYNYRPLSPDCVAGKDILIGSPIYKEGNEQSKDLINKVVVLRIQPRQMSFKELLLQVKEVLLEAIAHQNFPVELLPELLNMSYSENSVFSLFEISLLVENIHEKDYLRNLNQNMCFSFLRAGDVIEGELEYNSLLYNKETANRIIRHFNHLLLDALTYMEKDISALEMFSEEEKEQLLLDFNNTKSVYPFEKTVHQLFEEQADSNPDCISVVGPSIQSRLKEASDLDPLDFQLSYQELNRKSDIFTQILKDRGVGREHIVAIMMDSSLEMITGLLAILKAGAAYMPVNPDYPLDRKQLLFNDSSATVLLTDNIQLKKEPFFSTDKFSILVPEVNDSKLGEESNRGDACSSGSANDLVYVIFTSGSTGNPKGVLVQHRNVVRLVTNTNYIKFRKNERIMQTGALEFDASTFEIWGSLLNGLPFFLSDKDSVIIPQLLKESIRKHRITMMWMTSPLFNQMVETDIETFYGLGYLLVGGDILSPSHISRIRQRFPQMTIINGYGPTENTTFSTTFVINREYSGSIPIGTPVANSTAYIVDRNNYMVPVGAVGELIVGGDGVSRGYLNNPELTKVRFCLRQPGGVSKKFTNDLFLLPFYRTGDLARWLPDGCIEFLGRIDQQVKIRGFRIELEEIENRLLEHERVKEAVVVARGRGDTEIPVESQDKYLCAYIVPSLAESLEDTTAFSMEFKKYLAQLLPDYMVPSFFVPMEKISLTPNGKIDRKALPEPEMISQAGYSAPRDEIEKKLISIWSEVLFGPNSEKINELGIDDNFFQLGGHSLKATVIVARIHKELNVRVPLPELFRNPTIRELAEYIRNAAEDMYAAIEPVEKRDYFALSSAQKRMYLLHQMELESTAYNMPQVIPLKEAIDVETWQKTFIKLIHRHESLRTYFLMVQEIPVQRILPLTEVEFTIEAHTAKGEEEQKRLIGEFVRPFDLSKAPLLRIGYIDRNQEEYALIIDMHHIISDGVSHMVLMQDFMALFRGEALPPLRLHYKDFSRWQSSEKQIKSVEGQKRYWLDMFAGDVPVLELPFDYERPEFQNFEGDRLDFELDSQCLENIRRLAVEENVTLFMVLLTICQVLLFKLSNQEDIVIGTPVAGRRHWDLELIIGMFVNTLALRNHPVGEKSFVQFLDEVKDSTLNAFENQEYQFEDLVEILTANGNIKRDASRNPLFDVMFTLNNIGDDNNDRQRERGRDSQDNGSQETPPPAYNDIMRTAKFDLTITTAEAKDKLIVSIQYCTKLFKKDTIKRFSDYFKGLLNTIPKNSQTRLWEIELLSVEEKQQILNTFNDTETLFPKDRTIYELFSQQVEKAPDNVSLVGDESSDKKNIHLSYYELKQRTGAIANFLMEKGVKPNSIVGIMMRRSFRMVLGILGTLNAGAAYLPIEPHSPLERIHYMLADSNTKILLTGGEKNEHKIDGEFFETVELPLSIPFTNSPLREITPVNPHNLAYIIYTSGSTGIPKGVLVEHGSVVNILFSLQKLYPFKETDTYLFKTSYIFDVSVSELFGWFFGGGRLALLKQGAEIDSQQILTNIQRYQVTHINFVPSMFAVLIDGLKPGSNRQLISLKYIFLAGEALPGWMISRFRDINQDIALENIYGPTEATVYTTKYSLEDWHGRDSIPIGKPMDNIKILIIDKYEQLQAIGVCGELCIAGAGLARGYLNQVELTANVYGINRKNRIKKDSSGYRRLYKTGDLARWRIDGNIEFLGRMDRQVKIRGFRIELGEIENRLMENKGIKEAVVVAFEDETDLSATGSGNQYLCAYFVPATSDSTLKDSVSVDSLKMYLSKLLPDYMIPTYFQKLENIPLTPSGKIDRKALPTPGVEGTEDSILPRNEIERKLVDIWSQVLGVKKEKINIDSNFFSLGGHSLKANIMVSRIQKELNINMPLGELFKKPTIRKLGEYIRTTARDVFSISDDTIVMLRLESKRAKNIFFVHDGTGEVEGYARFNNLINIALNCWGIRADKLENYLPKNLSVKSIATGYIEKIRQVQPKGQGPYMLSGWSIGGSIVFEIARQLESENEKVAFVGLIDSVPPSLRFMVKHRKFNLKTEIDFAKLLIMDDDKVKRKVKEIENLESFWPDIIDWVESNDFNIKEIKRRIGKYGLQGLSNFARMSLRESMYYLNMARTMTSAVRSYVPFGKLNTPVHYFGARQSWHIKNKKWENYTTTPIEFHEVPGEHFTILDNPNIADFVTKFEKVILQITR